MGGIVPLSTGAESAAADDSAVLTATDSAWTTTRQPTTPQTGLLSATATADRTYLKFDGDSLSGRTVTAATLVVKVNSTTATAPGLVAYPTSASWKSATLTHDNQPGTTGSAVSQPSATAVKGQTLRIPLDVRAIPTTGDFALALNYAQRYVQLRMERFNADVPRIEVSTAPVSTATPTPTPTPTPTSPADTSGDGPLVFAHYFVPYPLSIDNKTESTDYYTRNYLSPDGEGGKFASVGGLLRDRPISPGVSTATDWRVNNFATEVRQAKSAGIDGFTLNLMSTSGQNWDASVNVMKAAAQVGGFAVVPMVDGSSGFTSATPETAASLLSQLYKSGSAYKEDGEYVLSSFKAEGASISWWTQVISLLETKYALPISFQAVFNNASDANLKAFAPIADGFGNWGTRTERTTLNSANNVARAHALGKTWMAPVAVQDVRFNSLSWAEANNTASVRAQWNKAIAEKADYVQLVTWNDYSESTQIAPSQDHGSAFLDLTRYYTAWFHTGTQPAVTADAIVLTHRTQFVSAKPSYPQSLMGAPALDGTSTPARDMVEALVWLPTPATVQITVGGTTTSFSAPAGVSAYTVPLKLGSVSAKIVRSGATAESVTSPYAVVSTPYVQDLQYYAVSSW
ncbi:endo-1,3-alpha-glucanase family glycosylhydrolase [Microbacterium trichothecenolyticum]